MNHPRIVITGLGLGLPGRDKSVFAKDNFELIFDGTNLITQIDTSKINDQKSKNIRQKIRTEDGIAFKELTQDEDLVKLAGEPGTFDLVQEYRVNERYLPGFDITSQLAIAAGLEALKDAGIPLLAEKGQIVGLPEELRYETGIIFGSTFPVLDSVLREQKRFYTDEQYTFDRKYLLKAMPLTHGHFAQIIKAKGPNTHVNVACASTTQAIAIAQDWIKLGRCKRVIVIAADDASNDELFQWVGTGFLAAGAATTIEKQQHAAKPFDLDRTGMILGMGAVALVLEEQELALKRGVSASVELLGSYFANSGFHATKMDKEDVRLRLDQFLSMVEEQHKISRVEISDSCVYFSHETYTPPRGNAARAEIEALQDSFGENAQKIIITNTKGMTAHPMGVGIEDVLLVRSLEHGRIPPVMNLESPEFSNMRYSKGETISCNYGLRFAAGFGSQFVYLLFRNLHNQVKFTELYQQWLKKISGGKTEDYLGKTYVLTKD